MSEEKQEYKYAIPRNVNARFTLGGLDIKRFLLLLPFGGLAFLFFLILPAPPKFIVPFAVVIVGYFSLTQEIDGETLMEMAENLFLDIFRPKTLLWEEEDHARYYSEFIQTKD